MIAVALLNLSVSNTCSDPYLTWGGQNRAKNATLQYCFGEVCPKQGLATASLGRLRIM